MEMPRYPDWGMAGHDDLDNSFGWLNVMYIPCLMVVFIFPWCIVFLV